MEIAEKEVLQDRIDRLGLKITFTESYLADIQKKLQTVDKDLSNTTHRKFLSLTAGMCVVFSYTFVRILLNPRKTYDLAFSFIPLLSILALYCHLETLNKRDLKALTIKKQLDQCKQIQIRNLVVFNKEKQASIQLLNFMYHARQPLFRTC